MTATVRVEKLRQGKPFALKNYNNLMTFLTTLQCGYAEGNTHEIRFTLLFEHGDWYPEFRPEAFQATVLHVRDALDKTLRRGWGSRQENAHAIAEWRRYAANEITLITHGVLN